MTTPAAFADVPAVRALLADAYYDDPLTAWIFPDVAVRRDACAAWYGLFAEQYLSLDPPIGLPIDHGRQ